MPAELKKAARNLFHLYDDTIDFTRIVVKSSLKCLLIVTDENKDLLVLLLDHGDYTEVSFFGNQILAGISKNNANCKILS